jgi:hypothetical protein
MHMTFGRLGAVDAAAKMSGMEGALPATWRLPTVPARAIVIVLLGTFAALWAWVILHGAAGALLGDTDAYWNAAQRLHDGLPLYAPGDAADVYRYAPWFAWAWLPLTYLPQGIVYVGWETLLVAAAIAALWPIRRSPAILLFAPLALHSVYVGNVQMLIIAPLVYRLERRDGPLWIAAAASLKATPILLALVYVGRGEWRRAAVTAAFTALLVGPMLLYDLSTYPARSYAEISLFGVSPLLWAVVAAAAVGVALYGARRQWAWLAASAAVLAALPRLLAYDITFLLAGSHRDV